MNPVSREAAMQITATSAVQAVQPAGRATGETPQPEASPASVAASAPVRLLNPQPVIDPALGIVVTEYFNRAGDLTSQYPTERALANYRIHGLDGGTASVSSKAGEGRSDATPSAQPA